MDFCNLSKLFKEVIKYLSREINFGTKLDRFTFWSDLDKCNKSLYKEEVSGAEEAYGDEKHVFELKNILNINSVKNLAFIII